MIPSKYDISGFVQFHGSTTHLEGAQDVDARVRQHDARAGRVLDRELGLAVLRAARRTERFAFKRLSLAVGIGNTLAARPSPHR